MATITDPKVIRQLNERLRPHAEQMIGIYTLMDRDESTIDSVQASIAEDATVIDDGITDPLPFTQAMYHDYANLADDLLSNGSDSAFQNALVKAQVRPIDLILSNLTAQSGESTSDDDRVRTLHNIVRPRSVVLRRLKHTIGDDLVVLPQVLSPYNDDDVIDDGRAETTNLTVDEVRTILNTGETAIGSTVNTDARRLAVVVAAHNPFGG